MCVLGGALPVFHLIALPEDFQDYAEAVALPFSCPDAFDFVGRHGKSAGGRSHAVRSVDDALQAWQAQSHQLSLVNPRISFGNLASERRVVGQEAAHDMRLALEDVVPGLVLNQRTSPGDVSVFTMKNEEHSDWGRASVHGLLKLFAA